MSEESENQLEKQSCIVADFGDFLTKHPVGGKILDVKALPHNKDTILDAICFLIVVSEDEKRVEQLRAGALILANFQEGVGDQPLWPLGFDVSASDEDVDAFIERVNADANTKAHERYMTLQPLVRKDELNIMKKTAAAVRLRHERLEGHKL